MAVEHRPQCGTALRWNVLHDIEQTDRVELLSELGSHKVSDYELDAWHRALRVFNELRRKIDSHDPTGTSCDSLGGDTDTAAEVEYGRPLQNCGVDQFADCGMTPIQRDAVVEEVQQELVVVTPDARELIFHVGALSRDAFGRAFAHILKDNGTRGWSVL